MVCIENLFKRLNREKKQCIHVTYVNHIFVIKKIYSDCTTVAKMKNNSLNLRKTGMSKSDADNFYNNKK